MPATIQIRRYCGNDPISGNGGDNITGINTRANTVDLHTTNDVLNPIQIPTSGTNYSYWVTVGLHCHTPGPSGTINNLRFYTDGNNGFGVGVSCKVGKTDNTRPLRGYVRATGTEGVTGNQLNIQNHPYLRDLGQGTYTRDAFMFTTSAPLTLAGSLSSGATNIGFGDLVVYQIEVGPTAVPGVTPTETFTFRYDET